MRSALLFPLAATLAAGCSPPPSVQAVDTWLTAYAAHDVDTMVAHTWSGDKALVRQAMAQLKDSRTATLAIALPPQPTEHELVELEHKEPGRHTVLTIVTMKNPLAYVSKKVGHDLPNVPKTRPERRRFLSIQEEGNWGLKLDLAASVARIEFVQAFKRALRARKIDDAQAMLQNVPAPPDEANALTTRDRLTETLTQRLEEKKAKLKKKAAGAPPYYCFSWVHGTSFGRDCQPSLRACELANNQALRDRRETRKCGAARKATCFQTAKGAQCFGDAGSCLRASASLGTVTATCAVSRGAQ